MSSLGGEGRQQRGSHLGFQQQERRRGKGKNEGGRTWDAFSAEGMNPITRKPPRLRPITPRLSLSYKLDSARGYSLLFLLPAHFAMFCVATAAVPRTMDSRYNTGFPGCTASCSVRVRDAFRPFVSFFLSFSFSFSPSIPLPLLFILTVVTIANDDSAL